jgi:hypothetical protein
MKPRVVSLVPSVTETLLAYGLAPVACTRFCLQPTLEAVGGTKDPNIERIVELRPDLVIVDTEENRREDAEALQAQGIAVHPLSIRSIAQVDDHFEPLLARLGLTWIRSDLAPAEQDLRVPATCLVPIWRNPWMALGRGTYGASVLEYLGVQVTDWSRGPYASFEFTEGAVEAPDYVLAPDEPYPFSNRHRAELQRIAPTVFVDGQDLFWFGVRTPAAIERLRHSISTQLTKYGTLDSPLGRDFLTNHRDHQAALQRGDVGYLDRKTGLFVQTARTLAARPCCGNGCRHCPFLER